jgi:formyl-CoA transferase
MGADVVKIEPPGKGDPLRDWGRGDYPLWWEVVARNKRSAPANLRAPESQDLARRLIAQADILIENFRPGALEGWGLSSERPHAENPGLIIVRVSGYGQTGPYADRAGFGGIGEAMGEPELARDPRYIDHISRGKNQVELDQHIEAWTLTLNLAIVE